MNWKDLTQTWHYVEKWAEKKPDAEALVFGGERLTWGGFKSEMDLIAKAYIEAGIEIGDRVAMIAMARNEFLTTYMAAGKVGAMWLGLSPKFTLEELFYQIGDSKPKVLIALREYLGKDLSENVKALMKEYSFIEKVLVIGGAFEGADDFAEYTSRARVKLDAALEKRAAEVKDTDDALLLYTSGSTGKPKGVVHTHRNIVENIKVEVPHFHFGEDTRALLHFPINHVAADVEIGFACILAGGCIVCMDRFDPAGTLKMVEKEKITVIGQVPVMFLLEMKLPEFAETDFSGVKLFAWGGAAAPKLLIDALVSLRNKTGAMLITGYGSTECCGFTSYTAPGDSVEDLAKSVGKMAAGFELKIVDGDRKEVPAGTVGEMAMRGPFVMKGYLNRPDATAEVIDSEGWLYTSDLGYVDGRGCIFITGRKSEMFKTGGENVFPLEIEEALQTHPSVALASVISVPDEIFQEVGWAFIVTNPGRPAPTEEELRGLCKSKLANFKVPKRFIIRAELPLLATGKVNKRMIKEEARKILSEKK